MTTSADNEGRIDANTAATTTGAEQPVLAFEPQALAAFFEQQGTEIRAEEVDLKRDGVKLDAIGIRITMNVGGVEKSCVTNRNVFPNLVLLEMRQPNGETINRNHPELIYDASHVPLLKEQTDQPTVIISQAAYARLGHAVLIFYRQWREHEYSNEPLLSESATDSVA